MGSWKHYNLSCQTLNERNQRATSPLVSRELTRSGLVSSNSTGIIENNFNYPSVSKLCKTKHFMHKKNFYEVLKKRKIQFIDENFNEVRH